MSTLTGQRVAFTGKMATMTRPKAADLVSARYGAFVTKVTSSTTILVVGQEGWPLKKDGSVSDKLNAARELQAEGHKINILTEQEFLERLGMYDVDDIRKRYTVDQLGRLLQVPRDRLRSWIRAGLVEPVDSVDGVDYFDFHQVTGVRTLWELSQAGVSAGKIRESVELVANWLPRLGVSVKPLNLLERDGQVFVRLHEGQLADTSGQLHFDFEDESESPIAESVAEVDAESHWDRGVRLERAGLLKEAVEAYREALFHEGANAKLCSNLGNALFKLGQVGQAAERFRQAVEIDHSDADAWTNLGVALNELGSGDEAIDAFQKALAIKPECAEAHFNLADVLEHAGRFSEARRHWKDLVRLEPMGDWAEYARDRLTLGRAG